MGVWTPVTSLPTGTGRSNLEALTADSSTASNVGSDVFIYALGGGTGASTDAILVSPGGLLDLIGWDPVDGMSPPRNAYAAALANNFLFAVGGEGGAAIDTGSKANICRENEAGCGSPPDLGGWSSLSNINMQPRAFMGKAVQSGFLYLIGGIDAAGAVLSSTDQSVLGGQP